MGDIESVYCGMRISYTNLKKYTYIYIYISYLPTPPLGQFLAEINKFEFRVFLLLD